MQALMPHFPIKTVDVTNCAEYLCCIRSTVDMDINEVTLRRKNCLFKRRQRRPYAQLSHVDLHDCLCGMCVTVSSDLAPARIGRAGDVCGGISSGCFCDHEKMEKLHGELSAVYRNLSPDAVTVDEEGVICLIDFRLAKSLATTDKTYTLCGTPDYLSPEQVTCAGHDSSADLWGLGVLLWEVSAGEGPWGTDANEMNTYKKITDHTAGGLAKPGHFEPELGEAIDALLAPDPKARLGAQGDPTERARDAGLRHGCRRDSLPASPVAEALSFLSKFRKCTS